MEATCTDTLSVIMPTVATLGTAIVGVVGAVLLANIQKKQKASSASIEKLHESVEQKGEQTLHEARELRRHLTELESVPSIEQQIRELSDAMRVMSQQPDKRITNDDDRFDAYLNVNAQRKRIEALHRRLDDLARDGTISGRTRDRVRASDPER